MSETSGSGFGKFVPGFEFLQNLAGQAADGVAQGLGKSIPQLPNLGNWVAPTFNVEDLEKRIDELKAVHFWLDQNAKALGATIQALEVQKMTLATLQTMNFSLGDVANALKLKAADTVAGFTGKTVTDAEPGATSAPQGSRFAGLEIPPRTYGAAAQPPQPEAAVAPVAPPPPRKPRARKVAEPAAPSGVVDPMHWWGALTQQFQGIAANALKDVARQTTLDTTRQVASGLTEQAVKTATGVAGKVTRSVGGTVARQVGNAAGAGQAAARAVARGAGKVQSARKAPKARAQAKPAAATQALKAGEWPLPGGLFQVPGFLGAAPVAAPVTVKAPAKARTGTQSKTGSAASKTGKKAAGARSRSAPSKSGRAVSATRRRT